jgi:hypothetical protein
VYVPTLVCCAIMGLSPPLLAFNCANLSLASKKLRWAFSAVFSAFCAVEPAFSLAALVLVTSFSAVTSLADAASKPVLAVTTAFFSAGMGASAFLATGAAAATGAAFLAGTTVLLVEVDVEVDVCFNTLEMGVFVLTIGAGVTGAVVAATTISGARSVDTANREAATKLVTAFFCCFIFLLILSASSSLLCESRDWRRTAVVVAKATLVLLLVLLMDEGTKAWLVLSSAATSSVDFIIIIMVDRLRRIR